MKNFFLRSLAGLVVILLIVAAVFLVRHRKAQLANLAPPPVRPIPVLVKSAEQGTLPVTRHYLGTIEPVAGAVLSAQTTGYLTAVYKDVGDRLTAGEAAAKIDMRLPEAQKNALAAELSGAREDLAIKKTIRDRRRELVRERAVSQEALDEAELAATLAESRVRRLEQELAAAAVSLSFSRMDSFFDGIVIERMKDIGDLVTPGTPVLRVEDPAMGYKILVRVSQETVVDLPRNAAVNLTFGDQVLIAAVDRVHPAIVSGNLAVVEIRTSARPFDLPSYGVVGVDLTVAEVQGFIVDADCVLETDAGAFVFSVTDAFGVNPISVTVTGRSGNRTVVDGPLTDGLSLAAGPESMLLMLGPGVRVLPVEGIAP